MIKRDFLEKVITITNDTEMIEFAKKELALLDKKNEQAKIKRLEKAIENEPIENSIIDYLTQHNVALANELANYCQVSTSKIVAVANKMIDRDIIKVARVKIAKVGERNQYSLQ